MYLFAQNVELGKENEGEILFLVRLRWIDRSLVQPAQISLNNVRLILRKVYLQRLAFLPLLEQRCLEEERVLLGMLFIDFERLDLFGADSDGDDDDVACEPVDVRSAPTPCAKWT